MKRSFFVSVFLLLLILLGYLGYPQLHHALLATGQIEQKEEHYYRVPILLFHNMDGKGPYSISRHQFRSYLEMIKASGVRVIPLRTLYEKARKNEMLTEPSIVITIDDNFVNIMRVAAPLLREYGYPATFFVYIKDIHSAPGPMTSWEDLIRLKTEGFEIQNHSYTHTAFHKPKDRETPEQYMSRVHQEIVTSREELEKGIPENRIWAFALPMGYYTPDLLKNLFKNGYELVLTTDSNSYNLTLPFEGIFHRYTIQVGGDPVENFRQQLNVARKKVGGQ